MKLLVDENVDRCIVDWLSAQGYDLIWKAISAPGADDMEVAEWATRESRLLITFDRDFGELVFRCATRRSLARR